MTTFALVVPVFDEAARLEQFGDELVGHLEVLPVGSELIFVDDGSTDATPELIEQLIARHPDRSVRLLRRAHQGKGAAVAAGLRSSSAEHRGFCDLDLSTPLDQFELVRRAARRAPALVIGSRDLPASRLLRAEGPVREWLGIEIQEVPVDWRHDERSKVNVVRDGLAMVWAVPRIWRRARIAGRVAPGVGRSVDAPVGEVFDDDNAEKLMAVDRGHWWFRSKAAFVSTALRRTSDGSDAGGWLVDAGAGSGGVTALLGWRPDRVAVVEGNAAMVSRAHHVHGLTGLRSDVGALPIADGSVAVVCLLDVIEHVEDPSAALAEAARILAPGGRLVVNVPAHEWLWSAADEALGHVRRYDRDLLRRQFDEAGLAPELLTHVFSWLVPPVFATRRLRRGGEAELGLDRASVVIDRTAMVLTRIERGLIGRCALPFGTSLLGVARKPDLDGSGRP